MKIISHKPMIFVSHSHYDKEIAGDIKDAVERYKANVFVAHEDIRPTKDWQEEIQETLKDCDVFVALLTDRFAESEWTDQETGIAVALGKTIIPIKLDLDPYGFISKLQALKWNDEKTEKSCRQLVRLLVEKNILNVDHVVEGFRASYSFDNAGFNAELLAAVDTFSRPQIERIVNASLQNPQIWDSFKARPHLNSLFEEYSDRIAPEMLKRWKRRISGR